ncbi:hypothetical protein CAPTEDRAFT_141998 [Capitella teleta]|uniref:tRNA (uracil(54)-C(5))-methyltransferase n=1 Tax=Capitella teleta TaxID=283909 RepID=R7U624_CAPTE|nr:hypothetical protein CAPTEDRAFT_141998 [Capitella teleta]|eukprot:ELT99146.1 hypothetical protein CAPTEDRAFT_141998 [Capitella teleta]
MDDIKQNCIDFFFKGPGNEFNVKSLYFQDCPLSVCLHGQAPYEHLHGDTAIMETLLGCTFRIVPGNFFQVNVAAAEIMYEQIRQEAGFTKDSILLDLCCGTGIVSIIMSPHVKKSIGIELLQSSIDTAKQTAQLNGVTNVEFIQGKVERKLRLVTHNLKGAEVIAIVNPSRGGLGRVVLDEIRRCKSIRKVIYVSCKPMGRPLFNIMRLCQSGETLGKPFLVNRAIAIDMFPHTRHYEVIFSLQR